MILTQDPTSPTLADLMNRDIAMHRAAQTLADATRCQQGLRPLPLTQLDRLEREWFKQTARNLIEIFETVTTGREPDAVRQQREVRDVEMARRLENLLYGARAMATGAAAARGHDLGPWHCNAEELGQGRERAQCQTCGRTVFVNIASAPPFSGMAVAAGCLSVAEPGR